MLQLLQRQCRQAPVSCGAEREGVDRVLSGDEGEGRGRTKVWELAGERVDDCVDGIAHPGASLALHEQEEATCVEPTSEGDRLLRSSSPLLAQTRPVAVGTE